MRIFKSIGNVFKGGPAQIAAKAAGLAALGMVTYDSNYVGKLQADLYASERDAAATGYYTNNLMYTTNMSKSQDGIKKLALQMQLDQGWRRFFNLGIGYLKGFSSMLIEHVIPLGLGIGALFTKGKTSKAFAGGIGIYGLYTFVKNFLGWGNPGGPLKS